MLLHNQTEPFVSQAPACIQIVCYAASAEHEPNSIPAILTCWLLRRRAAAVCWRCRMQAAVGPIQEVPFVLQLCACTVVTGTSPVLLFWLHCIHFTSYCSWWHCSSLQPHPACNAVALVWLASMWTGVCGAVQGAITGTQCVQGLGVTIKAAMPCLMATKAGVLAVVSCWCHVLAKMVACPQMAGASNLAECHSTCDLYQYARSSCYSMLKLTAVGRTEWPHKWLS